jgi:hypothetical protein
MGKTIPSYRAGLEMEIRSLKPFRGGLKKQDHQYFDNIMLYARMHSDAGSLSARMFILEPLFLSALIEHDKTLEELKKSLYRIKKHVRKLN